MCIPVTDRENQVFLKCQEGFCKKTSPIKLRLVMIMMMGCVVVMNVKRGSLLYVHVCVLFVDGQKVMLGQRW